jgi:hypothetical protein
MKQHRSAASVRQARWRQSTELRRVEMYLLPEVVEWLDELAQEHGASSRAEVVLHLMTGAILPPLLVDARHELLKAYQTLLQAAARQPLYAIAIRSIMGKAIQQLEQRDK